MIISSGEIATLPSDLRKNSFISINITQDVSFVEVESHSYSEINEAGDPLFKGFQFLSALYH